MAISRTTGLSVVALCLAVAVIGGHALQPLRRLDCRVPSSVELPAPDDRHIARRFLQICRSGLGIVSEAQTVAVRRNGERLIDEIAVFVAYDAVPGVAWRDSGRLEITLHAVAPIRQSHHAAGDIEVVYRLAPSLRGDGALAQLGALPDTDGALFPLGPDREHQLIQARARHAAFRAWADAHAEPD